YLGGTYGDDIVGALLRAAGRTGNVQASLEQMTHRPADSLIADWHRALIDGARPVAVATGVSLPTDRAERDHMRMTTVSTAGAWDADGARFVFGAVVTGKPALRIVKGSNGDVLKEITFPTLGEIFNPTWSPDGKQIAFSSQVGGVTDLFEYDLDTKQLTRLT